MSGVSPEVMAWIPLCPPADLRHGGPSVSFDVRYQGQTCRAFAIRYRGELHAYLNRCSHIPMEMDWQPNQVFDHSGRWLLCATHGAVYQPDTGACAGGPCRGGLVKIQLMEHAGVVHWGERFDLKPVTGY